MVSAHTVVSAGLSVFEPRSLQITPFEETMRPFAIISAGLLMSSCASSPSPPADGGFDVTPTQAGGRITPDAREYVIGPTDSLNVTTFQVPDLTFKEIRVDASGVLEMPLIGSIQAAGRTPAQLGRDVESRLAERYLRDPRVTVTVAEAASQKITVDGAVTKPGVYEMRGQTTLLQAIAMAEGPSRIADLRQVAVFRTMDDQRMVALFDLELIRSGRAEDPLVMGNDVVVVDTSRMSAAMRDIIAALPGLAVFNVFR